MYCIVTGLHISIGHKLASYHSSVIHSLVHRLVLLLVHRFVVLLLLIVTPFIDTVNINLYPRELIVGKRGNGKVLIG